MKKAELGAYVSGIEAAISAAATIAGNAADAMAESDDAQDDVARLKGLRDELVKFRYRPDMTALRRATR